MVGVQRQTVNIWLKRYRAQGEDGVLDGRRVSPRRGKGLLTAEEARPGPRLDPRPDPGPAEAAVRLVDQPGGARPDRAALRQDARPVDRAALPAALGHDPAKAPGPGQGAPARGDRGLAGAASTRRSPSAPRPRVRRSTGATRPGSPTRTRSGAPTRPRARRRWSPAPPSGSRQSMISAVSNRGLMRFMFYEGALERRPVHRLPAPAGQGRRAEGVPDRRQPQGAPCHQGQDVGAAHAHEIELFYLPAYAPITTPTNT